MTPKDALAFVEEHGVVLAKRLPLSEAEASLSALLTIQRRQRLGLVKLFGTVEYEARYDYKRERRRR